MVYLYTRRCELLPKKSTSYRFQTEIIDRLAAWSFLLKKDKTQIIEESIKLWESNRPESERSSVEKIVEELQKLQ